MKINNAERAILDTIRKRYLRTIDTKPVNTITIIESAIMTIEMYNRNFVWRSIEYVFLFLYSTKYVFTKKFDNLSIGRYQLKISCILDYLNIKYLLAYREITLENARVFPILKVFLNRNTSEVLAFLITSEKFKITQFTNINSTEVRFFIEEYSRTLSTDIGFSYYFVFMNTVNQDQDI